MMYNSHSQKYNDIGKKFFKINYIVSDFTHKKKSLVFICRLNQQMRKTKAVCFQFFKEHYPV